MGGIRPVVVVLLGLVAQLACSPLRYFPSDKIVADSSRDPAESYRTIKSLVAELPPGGGSVDPERFTCSLFVVGPGRKISGGSVRDVGIVYNSYAFQDVKAVEVGGVLGSYLLIVITEDGEYHDCWAGDPMYSKKPIPDDYDEVLAKFGAAILEYARYVQRR